MAAETLNFGPEWLRALSSGGSVASPPPSPAMPKYKLADYRYGREEMLALYVKENKVPAELQDKEFAVLLQEEPLQPLALEPLTEEEQRNFSLSVNSVAVLRLMGKGAGPPLGGTSRGRGSTRSRGRGRGDSCFYQRSIEEGDGAFGRNPREIQRSQSWDDRGERRFEKSARRDGARSGFEEGGAGPRKEHARSDSENWRSLREEQEEEEEGSWRLGAGPRRDGDRWRSASPDGGPRSAGWREHGDRRRKFEFDLRGDRGGCGEEEGRGGGGSSHLRRCRGPDGFEEDKDGLPEWCLDDEDEEMGTFDASGAFLPLKKGPKEPIPEEQELDFQGLEEEEEEPPEGLVDEGGPEAGGKELTPLPPQEEKSSSPSPLPTLGPLWGANGEGDDAADKDLPAAEDDLRGMPLSPGVGSSSGPPGDLEDDEGLKHLQQEAEKLVASLQDSSLEEEQFTAAMQAQGLRHSAAATALPLSHGAARKWFYKDPQGEIQGPFTTQEMAEWFQAGYFSMALLVKRGCDEGFQPLGEVIKMWGRVPFAPGPSPPPLLVSPAALASGEGRLEPCWGRRAEGQSHRRAVGLAQGNMDQERLKKQQELAAAALYQQLQHQQFLQLVGSRQLPQCALREKAALGDLSPPPQQLTAFLQQLQALKPPRGGDQNLLPTMNRSLSVPDSGSLWDIHTSASSQSGGEASLWDIPINSSTQGPILEQLQLQHKFQERREAELRAKREEEERKRREEKRRQQQQEEQKRRQEEEELFRRKQVCARLLPASPARGPRAQAAGPHRAAPAQVRQQELLLKLLQQQQAVAAVPAPPAPAAPSSPPPLWAGLAKQGLSMKTLLELQLEGERQLHKQAPSREPSRAQAPNHRVLGGLGSAPLNQWVSEAGPLWGGPDKSGGGSGGPGLWEDTLKSGGSLARGLGLKNSRSSPSLSDSYSHLSGRPVRKKTEEEEKLLKLLQGIPRPQDGFTQWCEQMLHTLSTTGSLDVPMAVAILKEVESPYDVHDYIRSCLGDTLEAKEFAKQFLERRAKQKASQQRQQQQEAWLSSGSLQTAFQTNHSTKLGPGEGSKAKRRALMLHSDPSILGYSLHGPSGEIESVDDY
ncbi:GRB10-interacting GYF protein 1 isoform X4 [Mirounga angustirostris]|uniref:GRB10-interacting GYF protein 1 isoform X1 n=1 Tax=Mirounga leonina TaxID=9715 RepID=UPI00156C52CC|nr:GRB10-interacting GYF protein 1 isoform X1 [Mirounga leonina]XP_034844414.1 GRB10-interacting GYF protein 1 isoform X1 [Mirounga leonina]XP_034844415.1 GRB10-interacting GYF protein 1 isoform X1 [Mirounga leonina]XP_034844416.1 GRB10-interacting GYF protein 1 isoform X1 [Mirounga leonina]XP_034844418.1 GRB10-interacting GYF protein 1 isoform X1 [Mirounga leonina]XP_034844421.1 GRB10-interacting GYF protein 1 isoform X1 [Mirounga leonina]